jgi:hypothetical protein
VTLNTIIYLYIMESRFCEFGSCGPKWARFVPNHPTRSLQNLMRLYIYCILAFKARWMAVSAEDIIFAMKGQICNYIIIQSNSINMFHKYGKIRVNKYGSVNGTCLCQQ